GRDVRVLGVGPGTAVTGYGVIETGNGGSARARPDRVARLIECGVIRFAAKTPLPERLRALHEHITGLIARHRPGALALENAFYAKNVHTTLVLGHARGVILLAAEQADRVLIHTAGGVGYEIVVPLGVMERLPAVGETVSLATELVVREDGWSLYGFHDDAGRRFFQRLIGVSGVGPKIAIALMSALGVERGARAVKERNIALLASVSGIGKKTAERLALELADKLGEFDELAEAGAGPTGRGGAR